MPTVASWLSQNNTLIVSRQFGAITRTSGLRQGFPGRMPSGVRLTDSGEMRLDWISRFGLICIAWPRLRRPGVSRKRPPLHERRSVMKKPSFFIYRKRRLSLEFILRISLLILRCIYVALLISALILGLNA